MSFALGAGVTGLQAHQKMLDIAGNNLANLNTTGFKASDVTFSELLSQTIKNASEPTATIGGTNPQQMGSGVGIASITRDMSQGDITATGQPLDCAIEGQGYFVLNDGQQNLYTRVGAFDVDSNSELVDPSTGYHVQRIGSEGELDGFQQAGDSNIHIPYNTALPAKATSTVTVSGNLSSDESSPQTQLLNSSIAYTVNGNAAQLTNKISDLDQFSGSLGSSTTGTITITGSTRDGTAISSSNTLTVDASTTLQDLVDKINTLVGSDSTATINSDGKIQVTDVNSGYSKTDLNLSYTPSSGGTDSLSTPNYFEIVSAGGQEVKNVNIQVYDAQGGAHTLNAALVRSTTANTWDMVLTSVTGNISSISDRRITGITFSSTGAFDGLNNLSESPSFGINFANDPNTTQNIQMSMGTIGNYDGLTQFSGDSTAVASNQDGYEAGRLSSLSVSDDGTLVGAFSNGVKKNIATIQIALFQNPAGLESAGGGYFTVSANSGTAVATQGLSSGAGTIHGGSLENSNVDTASEFVKMIEAQNGYEANSKTIQVANDILKDLSNLIQG
jgi:flagellar hook protein FlgE